MTLISQIIIGIIGAIAIWFMLIILLICISTANGKEKWTIRQATDAIFDFITKVFLAFWERLRSPRNFPVAFGWNGWRFSYDCVDVAFNEVGMLFSSFYCSNVSFPLNSDILSYTFRMSRKLNTPNDNDLTKIVTCKVEAIVARQLRISECNAEPRDIVYVTLLSDEIVIDLALNSRGVKKLIQRKNHERELKCKHKNDHNDDMTAEWEDD